MPEVLMPEYAKDFQCTGSECEDNCCHELWTITIDKNTYRKYMASEDPELKPLFLKHIKRFQTGRAYARLVKNPGENTCPFETEEGLCSIQLKMGFEALSITCATYPRRYKIINNTDREMALSLSCPVVAQRALLNKKPMQFIKADVPFDKSNASRFRLDGTRETDPAESFYAKRSFIIETLQNRNFPFENRLLLLGMFIQKLSGLAPKEVLSVINSYRALFNNPGIEEQLDDLPVNPRMQALLISEVINRLTPTTLLKGKAGDAKYLALLLDTVGGLGLIKDFTLEEQAEKYLDASMKFRTVQGQYDYIFENYFVNTVFSDDLRIFGYERDNFDNITPDKNALWNFYLSLCLEYLILKFHFTGLYAHRGELSAQEAASAAALVARDVLAHSRERVASLLKWLKENNYDGLAHMATAIRL